MKDHLAGYKILVDRYFFLTSLKMIATFPHPGFRTDPFVWFSSFYWILIRGFILPIQFEVEFLLALGHIYRCFPGVTYYPNIWWHPEMVPVGCIFLPNTVYLLSLRDSHSETVYCTLEPPWSYTFSWAAMVSCLAETSASCLSNMRSWMCLFCGAISSEINPPSCSKLHEGTGCSKRS